MPSILKKRGRSSKKKKVRIKRRARPYDKHDKVAHLRRRYRKRHAGSAVHGHKQRMRKEAETMNYLLHQLVKSQADPKYNYHPRHHSKDPEYKFSSAAKQEFKRGVPAPDVNFWNAPKNMPPYRANYPAWEPTWEHPHA